MKISKIHNICIGGGILLLALFTSCKNFLDGSGFLAELEKSMSYANAPYVNVTLTSKGTETATLIPATGTYSDKYKATDKIKLQFEPQINYYFTGWTAEPEESVVFEDAAAPQTTVTILSIENPIVITANTKPRPKIVNATPAEEQSGVYRDRTIVVKFNQEMSEDSIYWTYSELQKEGGEPKNAFKVDTSKADKDALYYGYWDGKNKSSIKYKNIEITDYMNTSINLLQYYGIPRFADGNTRILNIPTKLEDEAPPSVTDIMVTIKKDFFCVINKVKVCLSEDYDWTYFTNGNTDNDPPVFVTEGENKFTVYCTGTNKTPDKELTQGENLTSVTDKTTFLKNFSQDKKLYVRGCFRDEGSGPAKLSWTITKVSSSLYGTANGNTEIKKGQTNFTLTGTTANFDGNEKKGTAIDLSSIEDEGLYKIVFVASDNNAKNSKEKSFYFFHDAVGPKNTNYSIKLWGKDLVQIELDQKTLDYNHSQVVVDDFEPHIFDIDTSLNAGQSKCKEQSTHSIEIVDYDFAENYSTKSYSVNLPHKPAPGMILYTSGYWSFDYVEKDLSENDVGTPIGIIWKVDDITKCQIWALDETTECCWGSEGYGNIFDGNYSSKNTGYSNYQTVCTNYKDFLTWTHNGYPSMWYYTAQKNSYAKNYYPDLGITWYIPAVGELDDFREVYDVVENTINKLPDSLPVPELKYGDKSFKNTYHPEVSYTPNSLYIGSSTKGILYLTSSTFDNTHDQGIYWPVGYCNNGYPNSFYGDNTNHFDTENKNSPIKGLIDTHSTFVRSRNYGHIAHTMGQVDLSK